ncbi:MAG: hypothetical protein DRH37_01195 [Deltaproteobacteria bacterium]|nr:MAG: hypothetical protein DRH37_01195 [Deltaproteobacteria bacterium]
MNIRDLNKSISEMTDEELTNHIINIRKKIRTKRVSKKVVKIPAAPKSKFAGMSAEEKNKLIDELESMGFEE